MANPIQALISNAEAVSLSDAVHGSTGARYMLKGVSDATDPDVFARFIATQKHALELLGRLGGAVIDAGGLNVGVFAMNYAIGGVSKSYAGDASFVLAASVTSSIYLDAAATLKVSTTGWPAGDHVRLAVVVTNATTITSIAESRLENFQVGLVNRWSAVIAQDPVDLGGFSLGNIGQMWPAAATTLTIAAGSITPTSMFHTVDTEAAASSDDLTTITADANKIGQILILQPINAARVVTIKSGGNLAPFGDFVMDDLTRAIVLLQFSATQWIELTRNYGTSLSLTQDQTGSGVYDLFDIAKLRLFKNGTAAIVSGAAITASESLMTVKGQVGDNDLSILNGLEAGQILILEGDAIWPVTVKATGGNIQLTNGADMTLDGAKKLVLFSDGVTATELSRSGRLADLVGTGQVVPYSPGTCFYAGALTNGQKTFNAIATQPFKLKRIHGYVVGVPVTTSCVVRVLKNGASVFAADADAINILAAANSASSIVIDVDFIAGDVLAVEVVTASGATDLTVTMTGYTELANP